MTLGRVAALAGVALLVMVVNVLITILYMVVYGHVINPGHEEAYYREHVKVAAPYCSIVAGIPLMLLTGWWVGGWWGAGVAVQAALTVWIVYALVDSAAVLASGFTARVALLWGISLATKLASVCAGALLARTNA